MIILLILSLSYVANSFAVKSATFYTIKYISNKSFSTTIPFETANHIASNSNVNFLKCLDDCLNSSSCSSVIFTKNNISFSFCSIYKNSPNIDTDLVTSDNYAMYQKILKSNFFFFLNF